MRKFRQKEFDLESVFPLCLPFITSQEVLMVKRVHTPYLSLLIFSLAAKTSSLLFLRSSVSRSRCHSNCIKLITTLGASDFKAQQSDEMREGHMNWAVCINSSLFWRDIADVRYGSYRPGQGNWMRHDWLLIRFRTFDAAEMETDWRGQSSGDAVWLSRHNLWSIRCLVRLRAWLLSFKRA